MEKIDSRVPTAPPSDSPIEKYWNIFNSVICEVELKDVAQIIGVEKYI